MIIIFFSIFFFINLNIDLYKIPINKSKFYIIPDDPGGEKVMNLNKKSLHMNYSDDVINENEIIEGLKYTIQIFTSDNYKLLIQNRDNLIHKRNEILNQSDFYILHMDTSIGNEYFLTYKNFNSKKEAEVYCKKYLFFVENCITLNAYQIN